MKVLLIHNHYQQHGGESAVVEAELRLLREAGVSVECHFRHNDELKGYNAIQKALFPLSTLYSFQTVRQVRSIVKAYRPDVAYLHNIYPLISPSVYDALSAARVPIVQVVHDYRPFCSNGWFYVNGETCERCLHGNHIHAVYHRCYRNSRVLSAVYAATMQLSRWRKSLDKVDVFICVTEDARLRLTRAGVPDEKIIVRAHWIDAKGISASDGTGANVLSIGRLSREKGHRTLLEAFRRIPQVPLVVAGTGPMMSELTEYASRHEMRNVEFVGFQSGQAKDGLFARARICVVPSEWPEMFGMTILESFSAGRPVIGSNSGGIPYVIEDGKTGLIHEAGDAVDLAAKIQALYRDDATCRSMGRRALEAAGGKFGPSVGLTTLMGAFAEAIKRAGARGAATPPRISGFAG